ncbi:MAG TPA: guanylate kinase [Terriglobales bacterium]|nr:guanylate kinase [Terriglobales bacterium]
MPLFIISAPSGSGKSTLVRELFRLVPGLNFSISYTTRAPRGSEQDGREYFFVDRARFQAMVADGAFLEHAEVFGNFYGTAWSFLDDAKRRQQDLVLDIDIQGAQQVKQRLPDAVSIFIAPPNRETLAWRLRHRGLDAPEVIATRLADASREIGAYNRYDYVVINDRLEESVEQLCAIVRCQRGESPACAAAAACRQSQAAERLRPVLESFGLPVKKFVERIEV